MAAELTAICYRNRDDPRHGKVLKAVFPAVSQENYLGKNCTQCHTMFPLGTVLGAVTMEVALGRVQAEVAAARTKLIGGAVVALGVVLLCIYGFLQRFVSRPLGAMAHGLRDIADGEGDLTQRLPVAAQDEVGQVAAYFNRMTAKLQGVIRNIAASADQVSTAASGLQSGTALIRSGALDQTEKSASAASAVEQMAASIDSVASASADVLELSRASVSRAEEGNRDVLELTDRLADVEAAVSKMTETVGDFIRNTDSITTLTARVKEIAEQTNLLALNAAIEAARAGEQGRGFAVVADEVRKLAETSTRSASDIDDVTRGLNAGSEDVRSAIEQGARSLQLIRESMLRVSAALESTMDTTARVADARPPLAGGGRGAPGRSSRGGAQTVGRTAKSSPSTGSAASRSSRSTRAERGPLRAHATNSSTTADGPQTSASTVPSRRLRTHPDSPSRAASACALAR